MQTLSKCPLCSSDAITHFLDCNDFSFSGEVFKIQKCQNCNFVFTNPRPEPTELGKYYESPEYVSHTKTKKGLINFLYHIVKQYSLVKKIQLINRLLVKGKLLDYGCGTGDFLSVCKNSGWEISGIEPNAMARKSAEALLSVQINDKLSENSYPEKHFDIITLWHVLEHISDLDKTVNTLLSVLKPGGIFLVAVPNYNSYDARVYGKYWAAFDVPRHLYHFVPETITMYFKSKGLKLTKTLPMPLDSFYVSMLSEKYIAKEKHKYSGIFMLRALWRGFISNIKAISKPGTSSSQIYIFKKNA